MSKWPKINCRHCNEWAHRLSVAYAKIGGLTTANRKIKADRDKYKSAWNSLYDFCTNNVTCSIAANYRTEEIKEIMDNLMG